jgi:ferredoxin-NADP reductase
MVTTMWQRARLVERRAETASAVTLVLEPEEWPGHAPGQHADLRLTADDGYQAVRSYSLAGPAEDGRIAFTVQRVAGGEVSPYLCDDLPVGAFLEVRGPVGGWFVWRSTDTAPVLLVAGGSGIVPLMAMVRARRAAGSRVPFRLIYSARTKEDVLYAEELGKRVRDDAGLDVTYVFTREGQRRRINVGDVSAAGWPADFQPDCFVCGPTGFVETVADILVALGNEPRKVKTERFGPTGG